MPEHILKTVRLSVTCRAQAQEEVRVHIGVLIAGSQDGIEHVRKVAQKNYIFSERDKVLNINDLLPYEDLNPCAVCVERSRLAQNSSNPLQKCFASTSNSVQDFPLLSPPIENIQIDGQHACWSCRSVGGAPSKSCFFVGEFQDSVKIRIVITPLP